MTTTTRRTTPRTPTKTRAAPPAELMDVSLDGFGEQIDAHLGRVSGFAEAVRTWRTQTDLGAALGGKGEYRTAVNAKVDRFVSSGCGSVDGSVIAVRTTGGGTRRVIRSEPVKAANPELWERLRTTSRSMYVRNPMLAAPSLRLPPMRTAREAWEGLELARRRATEARNEAAAAREVLLEIIDAVADTWDGSARMTTDGWAVGVNYRVAFDALRCEQEAVRLGIDLDALRVDEVRPVRRAYVLTSPEGDLDEMDGE